MGKFCGRPGLPPLRTRCNLRATGLSPLGWGPWFGYRRGSLVRRQLFCRYIRMSARFRTVSISRMGGTGRGAAQGFIQQPDRIRQLEIQPGIVFIYYTSEQAIYRKIFWHIPLTASVCFFYQIQCIIEEMP